MTCSGSTTGAAWVTVADDDHFIVNSARIMVSPEADGVYPSRQTAVDALPAADPVGVRQMFHIPGGGALTLWVVATFTEAHDEYPWVNLAGGGRSDEEVQDLVAAMFQNTESARVMYDDPAGTLSIDAPLPWDGPVPR